MTKAKKSGIGISRKEEHHGGSIRTSVSAKLPSENFVSRQVLVHRESNRKYYRKNRKKILAIRREYWKKNKEKMKIYHKKYMQKTNYRTIWQREKRKTSVFFVLRERLVNRVRKTLNYYTKTGKILNSIKYGLDYKAMIKKLIPLPFPKEDLRNWHIDHIIPVSSFDLTNPEEVKKAFAPENLQWLPAKENISKGGINRLKKET